MGLDTDDSLRILVVDDLPDIRSVISAMLRARGHEVVPVESPEDARSAASETQFDVAVLDVNLGSIDGPTLFFELQQRIPRLAPVFISGSPIEIEDGPCLLKPFQRKELDDAIIASRQARMGD